MYRAITTDAQRAAPLPEIMDTSYFKTTYGIQEGGAVTCLLRKKKKKT
jgi:hypothetical protein